MTNHPLTEIAIKAAIQAGKAILKIYDSEDFGVEQKSDHSPLTLADKKAHEIISENFWFTRLPILSEEGQTVSYDERKKWQRFWMVDPLDGTKEFIKQNGEFTVNIALIENNQPVLGVIYAPVLDKLYFGGKNHGAYCCEEAMALDYEEILDRAKTLPIEHRSKKEKVLLVVASRSHYSEETENYVKEMVRDFEKVKLVNSGSSLKLCLVAEGKAHVYPRLAPTMEWDTAAGHAIVNGAGGVVMQYGVDQEVVYNKEDLLNPWFVVRIS